METRVIDTGRGRFSGALIGLELALFVAALGGGLQLMTHPRTAMPADVLARTPFSSWAWHGVLLVATVAVPALVVAVGALARQPFAHIGHVVVGAVLMGWIVAQLAVIGATSWLQPVMFGWGLTIFVLGAAHYRRWLGADPGQRRLKSLYP